MWYNDYGFLEKNGFKSVPQQVMDNLTEFKATLCKTIDNQTKAQESVGNKINDSIQKQTDKQEEVRQAIVAQTAQQKSDAEQSRSVLNNIVSAIKGIIWGR